MKRLRELVQNLALSVAVCALLMGLVEGSCRVRESFAPPPPIAQFFSDLELRRDGGWYTVATDTVGWPPGDDFNADGLRDVAHPPAKARGVVRIAALGDSVTLGAGVEPREAWPQQLQALLHDEGRPAEVLNVALWGWSTREERLAYERIARRYDPDVVVLAVCLNDIPETLVEMPPSWIPALHRRSALVRWLVDAGGREMREVRALFDPDHARSGRAWERFFEEVRGLAGLVRADGAELVLMVLPFRFQLDEGAPPPVPQLRIAAFAQAESLKVVDLRSALGPLGPERAFIDHDHLTPAGADVVARVVREELGDRLPPAAEVVLAGLRTSGVGALSQPDPRARAAAAWSLGRATPGPRVVEALAAALANDAHEGVRVAAARALQAHGPAARAAAPVLLGVMRDGPQPLRWAAAPALDALDTWPEGSVPVLHALLADDDAFVRAFALWGLAELGPAAAPTREALEGRLRDGVTAERRLAAQALGRLGEAAAPSVPLLVQSLADDDGELRWRAARALGRLRVQPEVVVPALVRALEDPQREVRGQAARALGRFGAAARSAAPALREREGDTEATVRTHARAARAAVESGQALE